MRRMFVHAAVALLAGFVGLGCQPPAPVRLYTGPPRPANEVAVLWYMSEDGIKIVEIDGDAAQFEDSCEADVCRIELLPGHHGVVVSFAERKIARGGGVIRQYSGYGVAELDAHAGKFYTFSKQIDPMREEHWAPRAPGSGTAELNLKIKLNLKIIDAADPDSRFGYD